jgi:hypothetical protein
VKNSVGCPFISKENQTVEIHWIIRSHHFLAKPILFITPNKNSQSTLL